jgi:hypothetical protein
MNSGHCGIVFINLDVVVTVSIVRSLFAVKRISALLDNIITVAMVMLLREACSSYCNLDL